MDRTGTCHVCGTIYTYPRRGRRRLYCSGACRQRNHLTNPEKRDMTREYARVRYAIEKGARHEHDD
jgi:hypothetical protein